MHVAAPAKWCVVVIAIWAICAPVLAAPIGLAVNSRGNDTNSQLVNALWRINLTTGEAEYVGWTSYLDLEALALHPDGTLYGADDESKSMVRVSQVTGFAIPVGGFNNKHNMGMPLSPGLDFGMAFDCEGQAWVVSDVQQSLYRADMETGRLSLVGQLGSLGAPITDIAIRGSRVYGIGVGSPGSSAPAAPNFYRLDLEQATAELIGPLGEQVSTYNNAGLAFDEDGLLWAITDRRAVSGGDFPSEILRIDRETGLAEKVAETLVGVESLAIAPPGGCNGEDEDDGGDRGTDPFEATPVPLLSLPGLSMLLLLMLGLGLTRLHSRHH
jgi:sugar lactone lactonase YvrE